MRFPQIAAAATVLSLALGFGLPAKADLVIQGRAAQALQCASTLIVGAEVLWAAGELSPREYDEIYDAAAWILDHHVPGTDAQKIQAVKQRGAKIVDRYTLQELADEIERTGAWCEKEFL